MKKCRNLSRIFIVAFWIFSYHAALSQKFDAQKLQTEIHAAIEKGYAATVYLSGYDTIAKAPTVPYFSGVVVSADGFILTAAHACSPNKSYRVVFPDGKEYTATGLGRIAMVDAAIMKINEPGKWPFAEMGWSGSLKTNEPCVSIAYPGSFPKKAVVRFGYVADLLTTRGRMRTTCLMEPGDSGGPVFDMYGRVIGLHSSIDLSLEDNFEIPIDMYRRYWEALTIPVNYPGLPPEETMTSDPLEFNTKIMAGTGDMHLTFDGLEAKLDAATFTIKSATGNNVQTVTGTLFSMKGMVPKNIAKKKSFLVSKSSLTGDSVVVALSGGRMARAKVLARDEKNDLVLIRVDARLKKGIDLNSFVLDTLTFGRLGKFLLSPNPDNDGEVSVIGTTQFNLPGRSGTGYLGASTELKDGKVVLSTIQPNSAASQAKLEPGDEVVSINGIEIKEPEGFVKEIQKHKPDDKITVTSIKAGNSYTTEITLRRRPQFTSRHIAERFTDGKSVRRDGFEHVFVHDGKLKPAECGGPLFDLDGHFMGINIARYSRTSSLAIAAEEVKQFIETSMQMALVP